MRSSSTYPWLRPLLAALIFSALALAAAVLLARSIRASQAAARGIEAAPAAHSPRLGANVDLLALDDPALARQLDAAHAAGLTWLRQRVEWAAIEPQPGVYRWDSIDRLVDAARARGLDIALTVTAAPAWARDARELGAPLAPPADAATFGHFVAELARRYQGRLAAVQLWDNPNLAARAVGEYIPPRRYVELLRAGYQAAKAADPALTILGGGLAATSENSTRNQSDMRYLEWIYRAGGGPYFDALAVKPYGFWSGPDDRRVGDEILNFSRAVAMRETMRQYGDGDKPVWAVEWGWNALPLDWQGRPSPWGTDDAALQAQRTGDAIHRAQAEWPWLTAMSLMTLRPAAPPDDPVWGFTLLDDAAQARPALTAAVAASLSPAPPVNPAPSPATLALWLALAVGAVTCGALALANTIRLPWSAVWRGWDGQAARLGEAGNIAALAAAALTLAYLPWPLNLAPLALLALLVARRLDLGLAAIVVAAPFYLQTFRLAGTGVSLVEALTLVTVAAWAVRRVAEAAPSPSLPVDGEGASALPPSMGGSRGVRAWLSDVVRRVVAALRAQLPLDLLDVSVLLLLVLGAISPLVALMPGVANREFRLVILEPALFYLVLRDARLSRSQLLRLADALVLAGIAAALAAFLTYGGSGGIAAEGVRRLRGLYGSPNNLALVLGRVVPVALALLVWGSSRARRWAYAVALLPIIAALFLTFSTGAWLVGVPASLLFLGLMQGRRALAVVIGLVGVAVLALLPFARTERVGRLMRLDEAQTLEWRRLLWQSALDMIRDHPWLGVGLDNFLYEYRETYIRSDALADRNLSHPHNIVLDYWTRLGVLGVLALVMGQVGFWSSGLRLWRTLSGDLRILTLGLMASMVNFLAHGLLDNSFFLVDLAFIFMLTVGTVRHMRRTPPME
ncbi:MAG: O-antigen ligase family protein [Anaerolineae bacterium]|nr:O-antigen ligase family protein [Anaerolineae bacterium]